MLIDGIRYKLRRFSDEKKEFHPIVKEHAKNIFGEDFEYFDINYKLKSVSGIGSIPDACIIKFSEPSEWYLIENELSYHSLTHIVPQFTSFISGIDNPRNPARNELRRTINEEIKRDVIRKAYILKKSSQTPEELPGFLESVLAKSPKIAMIFDDTNPGIDDIKPQLSRLAETKFIEFKTFVREDAEKVHAHLFDPVYEDKKGKREGVIEGKKPPPRTWKEKINEVNENTRSLANALMKRIESTFPDATHRPSGVDYVFQKGKFTFTSLSLKSDRIAIRIRTLPNKINDPNGWIGTKEYHWFIKIGEKEFQLTDSGQIDYAMVLIKQSYENVKT